ncbi:MAG: hypothetical protein MH208_15385 [Marinobacter sp.]|nr:hypothetical protein [Marinobacter sp.]
MIEHTDALGYHRDLLGGHHHSSGRRGGEKRRNVELIDIHLAMAIGGKGFS